MTESLIQDSECRVSSVLGRNIKELGKQFLFDGDASSCWNSDQGTIQWICLKWKENRTIHSIVGNFQGGFSGGSDTEIQILNNNSWEKVASWYVEDRGGDQIIQLPDSGAVCSTIRILFNSTTDFYGRIIIYKLDVLGHKS